MSRMEPLEPRRLFSTYVLSPAGNDANPGTLAAPWQTLAHALASAPAGSTLDLRAGSYAGNVRIETPGLTIESYPGERATIAATSNAAVNIDVDLPATGVTLRSLNIAGGLYAIKTESTYGTDSSVLTGAGGLLIDGCIIHDSADHLVKISPGSDHDTITHSELYNSGRGDPTQGQAIDDVNGSYLTLEDSYIHDTTQNGVFVKGGSVGSIIQRNRFVNIGYGAILLGQSTDYAYFNVAANPALYESIDCTARNNIIINTGYAGIGVWASLRAHVYNNTIVNAAQQGQAGIYLTGIGHPDAPFNPRQFTQDSGVQVINNIVVQSSQNPVVHVTQDALADAPFFGHNLYDDTAGPAMFLDETTSFQGDIAEWQVHVNGDAASVVGNPMLDGSERPLAVGPAARVGLAIATVTDDFNGAPRPPGGPYDLGAVQTSSPGTGPPPSGPPAVQTLSLVNPQTDQPLTGYATIFSKQLLRVPRGTAFAIRANIAGNTQIVQFSLQITRRRVVRNLVAVDGAGGATDSWNIRGGRYLLTITPLSDPSNPASAGPPVTMIVRLVFYTPRPMHMPPPKV